MQTRPWAAAIDHDSRGMFIWPTVINHLTRERDGLQLGYPEFVDATCATSQLSSDDICAIVEFLRKLSSIYNLGATAAVVSGDFAYGMMRMLGILVEEFCLIEPFRSAEEAEEWLQFHQKQSDLNP
jgi:hypothetical protein